MIQSHLLQVLALTVVDADQGRDAAKLEFLNSLALDDCELKQFEGLLRSKKLKFHGDFADSTFCKVSVKSSMKQWQNTELVMQTGKAYFCGELELVDASEFDAPAPGLSESSMKVVPSFDKDGNGVIVDYNDPKLYFPKPYSKIVTSVFDGDYGSSFLTFDQCKKSWEIVTGSSPSVCLDPKPEDVLVYLPAFLCDLQAPEMCDQHKTVKDLYDSDYACTAEHDKWYADVDFYKAKCSTVARV